MRAEPFEQRQPEPLANARQTGVVGERLVEVVAEIPAVGEIERHRAHQLTLRAQPLKEEDQLQLEEDDRVNAWSATRRVTLLDPGTDEAEVQLRLQVAVEMVRRHQLLD